MIVSTFVVHNGRPSYIMEGQVTLMLVSKFGYLQNKSECISIMYIFFYLNGQWLKIDCCYLFVFATCILLALSNIKCNMNFHLIK
jgi:hypothetical protein